VEIKEKKKGFFARVGWTGVLFMLTAIFTVIIAIVCSMSDKINNPQLIWICDKAFYISMSLLFAEILWSNIFIQEEINTLNTSIATQDNILFPYECHKYPERILSHVRSGKAQKVVFICYGTGLYGDLLPAIKQVSKDLQCDIIMSAPDQSTIKNEDHDLLLSAAKNASRYPNVTIHMTDIPVTVRGCVIFSGKKNDPRKAIFAMLQPYYINQSANPYEGNSPAPMMFVESLDNPYMYDLANYVLREAERLTESSKLFSMKGASSEN